MLVSGVRSSWATSWTIRRRSASMRSRPSAIALKVRPSSPISSRDVTPARRLRSPPAISLAMPVSSSIGRSIRRASRAVEARARTPARRTAARVPRSTERKSWRRCSETAGGSPEKVRRVPTGVPSGPVRTCWRVPGSGVPTGGFTTTGGCTSLADSVVHGVGMLRSISGRLLAATRPLVSRTTTRAPF